MSRGAGVVVLGPSPFFANGSSIEVMRYSLVLADEKSTIIERGITLMHIDLPPIA